VVCRSIIKEIKGVFTMDIKSEVLKIIDELFMEDVSDMMDEDLFDAGVLDSMGTVELIVELENHFDITVPVSEFGRDDWNTANKIIEGITELRNA
jgi:D-alanine--poly(phosphoribitol) ligase, subunit 2